jgi:3-oxoadipate enol-lactonase
MPHLNLPDASLHYQQWGEGPCVAFLHGSGGNHLSWWQQIPTLSRDFRCLLLDLRGYGFSRVFEPSPQDPAVFGNDLIALLDHLDVACCHIVGQSIGGHYALSFALAHQQRVQGLVLADTLAGIADEAIAATIAAATPVPENLLERALGAEFRRQQPGLTFLYQIIERLNYANGTPEKLVRTNVDAVALASLQIPTLFLVGEHDPVAPAAAMETAARLVRGARFKMIPNAGHSPYFEQPEAFNRAILEFLAGLN